MDKCALYDIREPLLESHIIPKFFYEHLKEDAGNLPFYCKASRHYGNYQQKGCYQDGYKMKLLSQKAENLLSKYEKYFAENIFIPFTTSKNIEIIYDSNLIKFTVSLIWRCVLDFKKTAENDQIIKQNDFDFLKPLLDNWKKYITDRTNKVDGTFYLFPISEDWLDANIPTKYHRVFLCDMGWNFYTIHESVCFYAIVPNFVFVVDLYPDRNCFLFSDKQIIKDTGVIKSDIESDQNLLDMLVFVGNKGLNASNTIFYNKEKIQKKLEANKKFLESNVYRIYRK